MLSCETSEVPVAAHFREVTKRVERRVKADERKLARGEYGFAE